MFPFQHQHVSIPPKSTKSKAKHVALTTTTTSSSSAKFVGVRQRQSGRWVAEIKGTSGTTQKIRMWLGTFKTAEEAARAYDEAACLLRGSNTRTNFANSNAAGASSSPLASRIRNLLDRRKQKDQTQKNKSIGTPIPDQPIPFPAAVVAPRVELDRRSAEMECSNPGFGEEYSSNISIDPSNIPPVPMEETATLAMDHQGTGLEELFYVEDCNSTVDHHEFPSFHNLFCHT